MQARKCHGSQIVDKKLFVVGGTDSQRSVMSSEFLDLSRPLALSPLQVQERSKLKEMENDPEENSLWNEIADTMPSWHNGVSGLLKINQKLVAISVYGSDHDKYFDLQSRYLLENKNFWKNQHFLKLFFPKKYLQPTHFLPLKRMESAKFIQ